MQLLDIPDQLLQSGADRKAAVVRHVAEKHIEICDAVLQPGLEIAVAHGQFVKVAEHTQVQFLFGLHSSLLCAPAQIFLGSARIPPPAIQEPVPAAEGRAGVSFP